MRIGVLGGGQLGRMLALAGHPLGHTFTFMDPSHEAPMAPVARGIVANYDNQSAILQLADASDVVTWEFENVGREPATLLAKRVPVFPPPIAIQIKEDRLNEKQFFESAGIPTAPWGHASTAQEFEKVILTIGCPVVVKTRRFGYDGRGQARVHSADGIAAAWESLGGVPVIVETFIQFEREISMVAVRGRDGNIQFYPPAENVHKNGILHTSLAPAPSSGAGIAALAEAHARAVLEKLQYVGVLAIEFFECNGALLANEMAPRVHNSGHWTMDGAEISQFENHIRAVSGMPLGATRAREFTGMVNLIGRLPDINKIAAIPGAHLHLYGKSPRPGRKLAHVNLCQGTRSRAEFMDIFNKIAAECAPV